MTLQIPRHSVVSMVTYSYSVTNIWLTRMQLSQHLNAKVATQNLGQQNVTTNWVLQSTMTSVRANGITACDQYCCVTKDWCHKQLTMQNVMKIMQWNRKTREVQKGRILICNNFDHYRIKHVIGLCHSRACHFILCHACMHVTDMPSCEKTV